MSPLDWICSLIKDAFSLFFWKLSLQWMSGFYWFCVTCALHEYSCLRWPRKEWTKAVHMNIIVCLGFLCKDTYITVFGWILKAAGSFFHTLKTFAVAIAQGCWFTPNLSVLYHWLGDDINQSVMSPACSMQEVHETYAAILMHTWCS